MQICLCPRRQWSLRHVALQYLVRHRTHFGASGAIAAANYASSLKDLHSYEEVKSLLRRVMPAARRAFGETHELMLKMRLGYAMALYRDPSATLGDLREAVTTLEDTERTARRVLGGAHPVTVDVECELRKARAARGDAIAGEFLSSDT